MGIYALNIVRLNRNKKKQLETAALGEITLLDGLQVSNFQRTSSDLVRDPTDICSISASGRDRLPEPQNGVLHLTRLPSCPIPPSSSSSPTFLGFTTVLQFRSLSILLGARLRCNSIIWNLPSSLLPPFLLLFFRLCLCLVINALLPPHTAPNDSSGASARENRMLPEMLQFSSDQRRMTHCRRRSRTAKGRPTSHAERE